MVGSLARWKRNGALNGADETIVSFEVGPATEWRLSREESFALRWKELRDERLIDTARHNVCLEPGFEMNSPTNDDWPISPGFGDFDSDLQPQRRGMAWIAWIAIILTIGIELVPHSARWQKDGDEPMLVMWELQAKCLVGLKNLVVTEDADPRDQVDKDQAKKKKEQSKNREDAEFRNQINLAFGKGKLRRRLIGIVLIGDLIAVT